MITAFYKRRFGPIWTRLGMGTLVEPVNILGKVKVKVKIECRYFVGIKRYLHVGYIENL